jgi:hypothetical protein
MKLFCSAIALLFLAAAPAAAQHGHHQHQSKYAGQEKRNIKSLSPDDLAELRRGGGWGLAKAAELNGVPGPAHLLEMKDKIGLSAEQVAKIEALFKDMQKNAIAAGARLIDLERKLEGEFRAGTVTDASLQSALAAIGKARTELRYIHLSTHLKTPAIVSKKQIALYNKLRGYASDPCANVPEGHDARMWRMHNGCK